MNQNNNKLNLIQKEAELRMNIFEYFVKIKNRKEKINKFYTVTSTISFHKNGFRRSKSFSTVLFGKRRFIQICSLLSLSSFNDRCE
jgi:hypothetical protein